MPTFWQTCSPFLRETYDSFRYFSIAHLANAGLSDDELHTYRHALSKLLNSLSWRGQIVRPQAVDAQRLLFRIDVRDYNWNLRVWQRIRAAYPYGVTAQMATARACLEAMETDLPFIRADWFVATAARPPLYHDLLQLPATGRELEEHLRIDASSNIEQERVARAGFNGSGVSRNNRLIERHESSFGSYWKSYDFTSNEGRHNVFIHPLGPGSRESDFEPSGNEIIFTLPNGLHGYMLVNQRGVRIDKAPTNMVSDPRRPDRAVENGLSCMACHTRGIISKADQVRRSAEANSKAFSGTEMELLRALYPEPEQFQTLQQRDSQRFQRAVEQTGARVSTTEPIVTLAPQLESELDRARAAAELDCKPQELLRHLDESALLARALGALKIDGGTVQRQAFTAAFADIVQELQPGAFLPGAEPRR